MNEIIDYLHRRFLVLPYAPSLHFIGGAVVGIVGDMGLAIRSHSQVPTVAFNVSVTRATFPLAITYETMEQRFEPGDRISIILCDSQFLYISVGAQEVKVLPKEFKGFLMKNLNTVS